MGCWQWQESKMAHIFFTWAPGWVPIGAKLGRRKLGDTEGNCVCGFGSVKFQDAFWVFPVIYPGELEEWIGPVNKQEWGYRVLMVYHYAARCCSLSRKRWEERHVPGRCWGHATIWRKCKRGVISAGEWAGAASGWGRNPGQNGL